MKDTPIIETGVVMAGKITALGRYPYDELDVGQSIRFPKTAQARAAAKSANERYRPKEFVAGLDASGGVHVWRIE